MRVARPVLQAAVAVIVPLVLAACAGRPLPKPPTADIGGVEELTPEQGVSFYIPPFEVPPGTELQDCYFVEAPDLNNGQDYFVDRFKVGVRTGSHHMNIFRVKSILDLDGAVGDVVHGGECRKSPNWADWPLVVNSQESSIEAPIVDWKLPEGVAQRFSPHEKLMIQIHYVNADLQVTPDGGEVRVNFYKSALAAPIEMGTLFATQQSIRVCQGNPNPIYDGACAFPDGSAIHLAAMNGHFHGRGKAVKIYTWDGITDETPSEEQQCYESNSWDEPPMAIGLDDVVPQGGGIWWSCEYEWKAPADGCGEVNARDPLHEDDCCYTFGNSAEHSEHCNIFVYYWPKVDNTNIFCN